MDTMLIELPETAWPPPLVPRFRRVDPRSLDLGDPWVLPAMMAASRLESRRRDLPQVLALLAAGWRLELPGGLGADSEPMSWQWRSPPRRKGSRGKLHLSTNQAWNALVRQTGRG